MPFRFQFDGLIRTGFHTKTTTGARFFRYKNDTVLSLYYASRRADFQARRLLTVHAVDREIIYLKTGIGTFGNTENLVPGYYWCPGHIIGIRGEMVFLLTSSNTDTASYTVSYINK